MIRTKTNLRKKGLGNIGLGKGALDSLYLPSLVSSMLLQDVACSDHHPGCLDTVERSALLLLDQHLTGQ